LTQNYPNPFNPTTQIEFSLPQPGFVNLKVFSLLGKKIETLINNEYMNEEIHKVNFNPSGLNSGVYIYRLDINGFVDVKKMVYLK
jgi:hypothetical protein